MFKDQERMLPICRSLPGLGDACFALLTGPIGISFYASLSLVRLVKNSDFGTRPAAARAIRW